MYTGALFFAFSEAENGAGCKKKRDADEEALSALFSANGKYNSFFPGALMNII
jgi:hypothetical protein